VLARNRMSVEDVYATGATVRERLQIGMAYRRPDLDAWDALARYELHLDRAPIASAGSSRTVANVISVHTAGQLSTSWMRRSAGLEGQRTARSDSARAHARTARALGLTLKERPGRASTPALFGERRAAAATARRRDRPLADRRRVPPRAESLRLRRDDDLTAEAYTSTGGYLRQRAKVDEPTFNGVGDDRP
jgi:hypothetical protein